MDNLLKDIRYGVRLLARHPAFAAVAVLSLGLGVGVNTTIFSVVNAVLFKPTAVADPARLVELYSSPSEEMPYLTTSYPDFLDIRASTDAFSGLAAHALVRAIHTREGRSELITGEAITASYFEVLGVRPARGRAFLPEEERSELSHPVAILSHGFWQRRLGGDPQVLGTTVKLSGLDYTVVGVAPPEFTGTLPGLAPELWVPLTMIERLSFSGIQSQVPSPTGKTRLERRGTRWLFVKGRLAEGRDLEQARAQVQTVMARLAQQHPETNEKVKARLLPARDVRLHPMLDGFLAPAAGLMLGAVSLVLLIACANVANMLLARASSRGREIAVRLAIGAGRARLVRQLLTESAVLASLGGAAGLLLAYWANRLLAALQPPLPIPLSFEFEIDGRVLLFALGVSLATSLLFGLAPALQASRPALLPALKDAAAGPGLLHRRRFPFRSLLVVAQLAVSLVLLIAGALLLRALGRAQAIDPGFAPERLATLSFNLAMNGYSPEQATAFQRRLTERLAGVPGVEALALVSRPPLGSDINMEGIRIPGQHKPEDDPVPIDATYVEPGYFRTVGVPILEGRDFSESDDEDASKVVIVNQALAERYWPGRSALGERLYTEGFDAPPYEIVGVVRDYKVRSLGETPRPYLHFAWRQAPSRDATVLARAAGPAAALLPALRHATLELEPEIVFSEEGTLSDLLRMTLVPTRVGAGLLGSFALMALLLASVGLYGVIAYSVSQRTRELGVRSALGASRGDLLRLVVGQGMRLAALGVTLGALAAALLTRVLSALLYGVSSVDPVAFLVSAGVLLGVALLANLLPARRAAAVDPMVALRYE